MTREPIHATIGIERIGTRQEIAIQIIGDSIALDATIPGETQINVRIPTEQVRTLVERLEIAAAMMYGLHELDG